MMKKDYEPAAASPLRIMPLNPATTTVIAVRSVSTARGNGICSEIAAATSDTARIRCRWLRVELQPTSRLFLESSGV